MRVVPPTNLQERNCEAYNKWRAGKNMILKSCLKYCLLSIDDVRRDQVNRESTRKYLLITMAIEHSLCSYLGPRKG